MDSEFERDFYDPIKDEENQEIEEGNIIYHNKLKKIDASAEWDDQNDLADSENTLIYKNDEKYIVIRPELIFRYDDDNVSYIYKVSNVEYRD